MQVELNALLVCSFFLFLTPFPDFDESMEKKVQTLHCSWHMRKKHSNVMRLGCNQKINLRAGWWWFVAPSLWALVFFSDSVITSLLINRQHLPAAA